MHVGIRLVVLGRQPRPAGQLPGGAEPTHVADLGHKNRGQGGTDPGELLQRRVTGIGDQPVAGQPGEQVDLVLQILDQKPQRLDSSRIRAGHLDPVQQLLTRRAEQIAHRHLDAALGQYRMDLGLATRAQPDQLGPMPHQLAKLPGRRRRDPRLRQPAHPQQVGQVGGIPNVVLHPAELERLHPQRMGQMHLRAASLQRVHRPIPPVGGFQHHLRILTGPRHHRVEPIHVIEDPDRLQHLTGLRRPDNHTTATMQIDPHKLLSCVL